MTAHPLHTLSKLRLFRLLSRWFDPMLPRRVPAHAHPVYLRLLSHGSQIFHVAEREAAIRQNFETVLQALPGERRQAFWHVGANIGWFSWHCATARPDFKIVSFEPDAKICNVCAGPLSAGSWPATRLFPVRSPSAREARRFSSMTSRATGSLEKSQSFNFHHYGHRAPEIEVETVSLDDFLARGTTPPSLMKIDVEGAEMRILQGGAGVLRDHRPILFYESFNHRAEILALLKGYGYLVFESDRDQAIVPETTNFIALPLDRAPAVTSALAALGYPIPSRRG